jgi:predicted nucleotidyltransferase
LEKIELIPYDGTLDVCTKLTDLIARQYHELFLSVVVHGSVASNEVIPYSDFDGLLIVKDQFFESKKLKRFKKESMKIICKFDPLQHHGWFQINESQIKNYPEDYLPHVILKEAKVLLPHKTTNINIKIGKQPDFKRSCLNMINFLEAKINRNWRPKNMYQLKSFLSEIMLLPALYYSAKNGEGVLKKKSFALVREEFDAEEWMPITVASQIRKEWNYEINILQRLIMTRPERVFRKITEKLIAPRIPGIYSKKLNNSFYHSLKLLLAKMKSNLYEA